MNVEYSFCCKYESLGFPILLTGIQRHHASLCVVLITARMHINDLFQLNRLSRFSFRAFFGLEISKAVAPN